MVTFTTPTARTYSEGKGPSRGSETPGVVLTLFTGSES